MNQKMLHTSAHIAYAVRMDTMTERDLKPITQAEYIEAEMAYLLRRLAEGDRESAATSLATLRQELHLLTYAIDPHRKTLGRVVTENGQYYRWAFLDN